MPQKIARVAITVREYDEALGFYVGKPQEVSNTS
jgi:hypothetical protein